jgi:hypothetical protein
MISYSSLFTSITTIVSTHVKLPSRAIASIKKIGAVKLSNNLTLTRVLCVLSFTFHLTLASKLIKNLRYCLTFLIRYCFIQNLYYWRTIGVGKEEAGLLFLLQENKVSAQAAFFPSFQQYASFNSIKQPSYDVLYYRLGHSSISRIRLLQKHVPKIPCKSNSICPICLMAKQHKLPFQISNSVSLLPFDLIHCDIWVPLATKSINCSVFF